MMARVWAFTFDELEKEALSGPAVGYCWTAVIEEAVRSTLRSKKYPPDGWGYPGYGTSGLEWGEDAIAEVTDRIVATKFNVNKEHLAALAKNVDRTVDGIYALILRTVSWAIQDFRKNSVDGNAVRLIKEILKSEHDIVLKGTTSEADITFGATLEKLTIEMKKVPQNWSNVAELTKRGTPRKNLPVVFKKADLAQVCEVIAQMDPLPGSNQVWKSIQNVLPARQGTQAGNRAQAGGENTVEDEAFWGKDADNKMSSNPDDEGSPAHDPALEGPIQAFRSRLSGKGEAALAIALHPEFSTLPLSAKLEAVEVQSEAELSEVFVALGALSVEISKEFNLDQTDIDAVITHTSKALSAEREVW